MAATAESWKREPFVTGSPIPYRAKFTAADMARLREGHVPQDMDDKWFIYFDAPYLFFHHSWTGEPVYRVALAQTCEGAVVTETRCASEFYEEHGQAYQAELLDFLVCDILLGLPKPFPMLPNFLPSEAGD